MVNANGLDSGFQIGVTAVGLGGEGTQLFFRSEAAKKNRYVPEEVFTAGISTC